MDRRFIGFFFIGLGVIILILIIYFLFFFKFNKPAAETPKPEPAKEQPVVKTVVEPPKIIDARPVTKAELDQEGIKRLAASFAERFGSYSSHSNFQNMDDLKLFMTDKMKAWSEDFVKTQALKQAGKTDYYGITTKAITKKMVEFDEAKGVAKVSIQSQRRETIGQAGAPVSFGQAIEITLLKQGGTWKVDQAYWKDRQ
ncbi:hypothetical protein HGA34_02020 [Candidatus Falkowbacteria bacterium]|nr:hypothetical protein [Candidatus Falkowbacteria bacterium]